MRVHHLVCLTMCPPFAKIVNGRGSLFERGTMICHCVLLETDRHGLVLIDTAIGTDDCADAAGRLGSHFALGMGIPKPPPEHTALRQIESMGFSKKDVRHLVVTHLDVDHAGGIPDFPDAIVHVMAAEKEAALARRTLTEKNRYRPCHWAHGPKWATYETPRGERWRGFECVRSLEGLGDEVMMLPLSGHTRGHACVAVEGAPHGAFVHCGDAYFWGGTIDPGRGPMPWGLAFFESNIAMEGVAKVRENHARLRELAKDGTVRVFCAHDREEHAREAARPVSAGRSAAA
jgi:glyoxylase-like metal-dependent hydrolase (beta-lactamase superfamily II)